MRQRQIAAFAGVLLVLGAVLAASPSVAKVTRTQYEQWAVGCVVYPGYEWVSEDGVLHGRGRASEIVNYGYDPALEKAEIVGYGVGINNANIDLATGDGSLFGTFSMIYIPASAVDTFDGRWNGKLAGWISFSGKATARGTGSLKGMKVKMTMESLPLPQWLIDELTENPPPCEFPEVNHNGVVIIDPHGG